MKRNSLLFMVIIAIIVLVLEISRIILYILSSVAIFLLYISASILICISSIVIRLLIVNAQKFKSLILETDIHDLDKNSSSKLLKPSRFLNLMPIAMLFCSIADYLITIDFIFGMLSFLIAQIFYIFAFSGIIHINLKSIFSKEARVKNISFTAIMTLIIIILYFSMIYSPDNIITLFIIPYITLLTIMALIAFFGLGYTARSFKFRILLCGGGIFFVISDALIAISMFYMPINAGALWIGGTYLIAVFMLQFAMLFLDID